jgi:hypothetical protein
MMPMTKFFTHTPNNEVFTGISSSEDGFLGVLELY